MQDELEPTLLDYARYHGLAKNQTEQNCLRDTSLDLYFHEQEGDHSLFEVEDHAASPAEERLHVDKSVAQFLAAVTRPPTTACHFDEDCEPRTKVRRGLKQELPLLKTDHEDDLLHFAPRFNPSLQNEHLPLEGLDEDLDEGLGWPSSYLDLPQRIEQEFRAEKLAISKSVLQYLDETLGIAHAEGLPDIDEADLAGYKKNLGARPITPPLLPYYPSPVPYEPSSETGRLELVPDTSSPTKRQLNDIETRLLIHEHTAGEGSRTPGATRGSQDEMLLDTETLGELYSPLKDLNDSPTLPCLERNQVKNPKVEVPLTPPKPELPPFPENPNDLLDDALKSITQTTIRTNAKTGLFSSQELDDFLATTIEPVAVKAGQAIEQEQLQETDTLGRVPVPPMDFSLPVPPGRKRTDAASTITETKSLLYDLQNLHLKGAHWPAVGKLERQLQWTPFPAALARVETQEYISGAESLESFIEMPECIDSDSLVWKPDGLRCLNHLNDSDEEELSVGEFPESTAMETLIRKRKLEIQQRGTAASNSDDQRRSSGDACAEVGQVMKRHRRKHTLDQEEALLKTNDADTEGTLLGSQPLEQFLGLRKGLAADARDAKVKPRILSNKPETQAKLEGNLRGDTGKADQYPPVRTTAGNPTGDMQSITLEPELTVPTNLSSFVVSTRFLQDRKLAREIETLYPTAALIERDFSLYMESNPRSAKAEEPEVHLVCRINSEADLILSPSTGLVITTFQKIMQQALPGKKADSVIRERIVRASPRYERLIILVTGSSLSKVGDDFQATDRLSQEDCEALVGFIAFCTGVQEENQVYLVSSHTEVLAKWIVSFMVRYRVDDLDMNLLQEETLWEVFLRRAGLNAFAAQVICTALKKASQSQDSRDDLAADHGLKAFLKMSVEERLAKFEHVFGGRNLLLRVSDVVDACWR